MPTGKSLTQQTVLEALQAVKDPEIPVVSVVELGIVQAVEVDTDHVRVTITPTFLGCPALELMRHEIRERVLALGAAEVDVPVSLSPPWTSDRIAPAARERMRAIGLAPPEQRRYRPDESLVILGDAPAEPAECPYCGSRDSQMENPFGPTICRELHYCRRCHESFERFKVLT